MKISRGETLLDKEGDDIASAPATHRGIPIGNGLGAELESPVADEGDGSPDISRASRVSPKSGTAIVEDREVKIWSALK